LIEEHAIPACSEAGYELERRAPNLWDLLIYPLPDHPSVLGRGPSSHWLPPCVIPTTREKRPTAYMNHWLECDEGKRKRPIRPMLGFPSRRTATIRGFSGTRMLDQGPSKPGIEATGRGIKPRLIDRRFCGYP
jgi:hypothetical protein